MSSPYVIVLTDAEDQTLAARVASGRTAHRDRLRAQIVLAAARGGSNTEIAEQLPLGVDAVRRWRRRFATATGERLSPWPVVTGSLLGVLGMAGYLWRRHPRLRRSFDQAPLGAEVPSPPHPPGGPPAT